MVKRRQLLVAALLTICTSLLLVSNVAAVPLRQEPEGTIIIIAPRQDDTIRGVVQIVGTAQHPDFNHYLIEFGFEPNLNDQWFPVQDAVTQQVQQSALALWDTTVVADGDYQLRLRVVLNDGSLRDSVLRGLHVSNQTQATLPTIIPSATAVPTTGVPTAGPSPTALIQQPPTRTPRPAAASGIATATPTPNPDVFLERGQVARAAFRGTLLAIFAFALLGMYAIARRYARSEMHAFFQSVSRPLKQILASWRSRR